MNDGDLLRAVAARIDASKDALGLRGVSYPALNTVPASPWVMIRKSTLIPSTTEKTRGGLQVRNLKIDVVLLIVSDPKRPSDAALLDELVLPVNDLFDANANGGNVNNAFRGLLDEPVDRVWAKTPDRTVALPWAEAGYCYAAITTLDAEFKRRAQLP